MNTPLWKWQQQFVAHGEEFFTQHRITQRQLLSKYTEEMLRLLDCKTMLPERYPTVRSEPLRVTSDNYSYSVESLYVREKLRRKKEFSPQFRH